MNLKVILLGLSALAVAFCAAYFSVTGLSKLFAGAANYVIIMAGSLEFAKLVSAWFVHSYWNRLHTLLKGYLTIAIVILMLITSAGIYGFLTAAYKVTSDELSVIDKQTEVVELKKERYTEEIANYNEERQQLNQSINDLSKGLANNVIQYKDKQTGQIITTTSSATRRTLTSQLNDFKKQREVVTEKIDILNDSITSLDLQLLDIKMNNEVASEIGPLRYISDITKADMDIVVNWFALCIVLVFDPLAITLVIAFSAAMKMEKEDAKLKKELAENKVYEVYGENVDSNNIEVDSEIVEPKTIVDEEDERLPETPEEQEKEIETPQPNNVKAVERIGGVTRAEYEAGGWREPYQGKPYFYHPWFNWDKHHRWIKDKNAVQYWTQFIGNRDALSKIKNEYPDDFTKKTY